ncbi:hypothetical protein ACFL0H_13605 [Thermodesulfobacteriota bacterium]
MNRNSLPKYIKVIAYSGYKANEKPLYFNIGDSRLEVRNIIYQWVEPEKDYFKVVADDGKIYTLGWNRQTDLWSLEEVPDNYSDV